MTFLKKVRTIWLVCLLLMAVSVSAQKPSGDAMIKVDVTIVDADGLPLPGATVRVIGKKPGGVVSDQNGAVSLWVERNAQIEFKYVGMKSRTMRVTKPLSGNIVLEDEATTLDQVVVTGYQRTTKRRITGSVSTVTADDLIGAPTANLDMLLQGKMAGVDIKAVSGRPGESAKIRIRGTNTITGNADPLWVVDGVPLQRDIPKISSTQVRSGDFNDIFSSGIAGINPNDIESVTVLKDASAAAIYGSRAAGGVIVVTTKRGKEGKMRINYSANVSMVTAPPRNANLMNSREKLAWEQELWDEFSAKGYASEGYYPIVGIVGLIRSGFGQYAGMTTEQQDAEIERLGSHTTDWFKELFHNSVSNTHFLSLSGGSDKSTYYVSLGYDQNNGLVKKTGYDRYNVSTKLDLKPTRRVKLGLQADMSMQKSTSPSLNVDLFKYAYFANPYERPYNDDGSYAADNTWLTARKANGITYDTAVPDNGLNIFREMNETSSETKNMTASLIANLSVNITDHLNFEGMASYSYMTNNSDNVNGQYTYAAWSDRPFEGTMSTTSKRTYGSIAQSSAYNSSYNLRGQLHYFNTFAKDHYVSALFGSEIRGQYAKSIFEKRYGYDPVTGNSSTPSYPDGMNISKSDIEDYAQIVDGLAGQSIQEDTYASFYLSLDYVFKQRYILSLTGRTDGSNNFGSNEQFNPTGSIGLSWNVDQEKFFQPLKPVFSSLSLRAAMGYTGNINKSVYPQLVMDYSSEYRKVGDHSYRIGQILNAPNKNLRWEKTRDMKVSVDMGFLNDRLHILGELYDRHTYDAVSQVPVVWTTGFYNQSYNTSELLNQGAELTVSAHVLKTKDWNLSLSGNIAYNRNKLVKYDTYNNSVFSDNYVGYPIGSIISGKVEGIDPKLGIYKYQVRPDVTMNTAADRNNSRNYAFYLGTSTAPTNGGYSVSMSYKNLNLSLGGTFSLGGKILNNISSPVTYQTVAGDRSVVEQIPAQDNDLYANYLNVTRDHTNRWTPSNPTTNGYPRIIDAYGAYLGLSDFMITSSNITRASMLENVSYFKLGSILLSYNFEGEWMKRLSISSLGLSFSVSNVFTVTNYKGIDPETPGAVYPTARTFAMGVSVGF